MLHTLELLLIFDLYVCSRVKFHKSSFWVLILAAGGPYWVSISQKNGSLSGPYLKAWGSLIVLGTVPLLNYFSSARDRFRDRDLRAQKQGHNCVNLPRINTEKSDPKSLNGPYRYLVPKNRTLLYGI